MKILFFVLQAGELYAPGGLYASLGWDIKGWCDGTSTPTSAPFQLTGACEDDPWSLGDLSSYVEGDRVRKAGNVYKCLPWPYSLRCTDKNYEPENSLYWQEAWSYIGECKAVQGASVSIEGTLTIEIGGRRSLVSVNELDESETEDLLTSAQAAIESFTCLHLPDGFTCKVGISSINGQPVIRRLRSSSARKLSGCLTFNWVARITFPINNGIAEEIANLVSSTVSNDLSESVANESLVTSLVSRAKTETVKTINFGETSVQIQPPRVELTALSPQKSSVAGSSSGCNKIHVTMSSVRGLVTSNSSLFVCCH
jgi:hypothetical protein